MKQVIRLFYIECGGMDFRQIALISIASMLAAGLGVMSARLDILWLFIPLFASIAAGALATLCFYTKMLGEDVLEMRQSIENARQHITLLARHTRQFHDMFSQSSPELLDDAAKNFKPIRAEDFSTLSSLVSDIADALSELDQRLEAVETVSVSAGAMPQDKKPVREDDGTKRPSPRLSSHQASPAQGSSAFQQYVRLQAEAESDDLSADGNESIPNKATKQLHIVSSQPSPPNEPPHLLRQLVASAIAADRFDLCLQRIVGLPQRKIRGYEVMLRPEGADITLDNALIRDAVDSVGHQLMFDRRIIVQSIRLARAFEKRGRDVQLFVDLSQRFLMSRDALDEVAALIAEAPGAGRRIIFSFPARLFQKPVSFERECLRELASLGFNFMMRDVDLLDINLPAVISMGVRWIRLSSDNLLDITQNHETILGVDPVDVVTLLERSHISLLAHKVRDEASVAELLDLRVVFAQGLVFSAPQHVQAEAFELQNPTTATATPSGKNATGSDRRGLRDIARRTNG